MSTTLRRAPRPAAPELPGGELTLKPPPPIGDREGLGGIMMNVIPMLGSVGSIVVVAGLGGNGGRSYLAAGLFLFSTLGFVLVQVDRQRRQRAHRVGGSRSAYLRYLGGIRTVIRDAADQQRRALTWHHPDPSALPSLAADRSRLWERGLSDPRFLHVRYGVSTQPLSLELLPPESATDATTDPVAASALHRLLVVHRQQPDLPASLDLRAFARIELCGAHGPARALARALICSATASQGPEHLVVAVLASSAHLADWDWIKWLPHAHSRQRSDAVGARRMVSRSVDELGSLLPPELADRPRFGADGRPTTPHVLLVVDGDSLPAGHQVMPPYGVHGMTVVELATRRRELEDPHRVRLELAEGPEEEPGRHRVTVRRVREEPLEASADQCDLGTAEAFARRLAAMPGANGSPSGSDADPADLTDLLGLGDIGTFDPTRAWRPRPTRDRLRVPIGVGESGVVHLDLKESAQQGMGPHGLVIGATGSGKSELLRTLVLGLALTHSPEQLAMVLVDFKGGATFAGMSSMPHVSAVITNLAQELTLVDRMQDALSGEMVRRQELLRAAGNHQSLRDYERARTTGADLEPLPSLLIVVDEFSELLTAKPELMDLFVAVGRLGRSLGLHLLLASQRLEEGRLRGLESHLSYRIGLRTFSASESRAVLGVPDAYELPAEPGMALLRPDPTSLVRFRAAYVSGPPGGRPVIRRDETRPRHILPFTITEVPDPDPPDVSVATPPAAEEPSLLEAAVTRMVGHGPPAHQVWLPPLDRPDTLDGLLADLVVEPARGLVSPRWRALGGLVVPIGTLDRPRDQRRDVLSVDLGGAAGHLAVTGAPRTGKSTVLRSLVASLSLTTTPQESQFFVLDFGGGTFAPFARLPHVAGVAGRSEPDVVRRIVAEVRGVVDRRETFFRDHGIDSIETYRRRRAVGSVDDGYGDVFLVVDGWGTLRSDFEDLELELHALAARGLTFGLHLVVASTRWADFRSAARDLFGSRLELRLGDPLDSEVDRRLAALVPTGRPGRGLVGGGLHFLAALPRIDGRRDAGDLSVGVDDLVERVSTAWQGPSGPRLRLLPQRIGLDTVRVLAQERGVEAGHLLIGLDERDLAPVSLDPGAEPHLLVFGDGGSGKSGLLRVLAREIMRAHTPEQAQIILVDYRRSLLGEVSEDYLLHYLTNAHQAVPALTDLGAYLTGRIPGPEVTPDQLRHRSWWTGAEVFVLVDDYDLVATQQGSPLAPLVPLIAQARDIGLHLVVARRSGGASRALYEPVVQSLRELAMPGLLLSGSAEEGPLIGPLRPAPAAPGRGRLMTRERGVETLQLAWDPPAF